MRLPRRVTAVLWGQPARESRAFPDLAGRSVNVAGATPSIPRKSLQPPHPRGGRGAPRKGLWRRGLVTIVLGK